MGAFSPSRIYTPEVEQYCIENIFKPTIQAMAKEGCEFMFYISTNNDKERY